MDSMFSVTINGLNAGDVIRAQRVVIAQVLIIREHDGPLHRRMRQPQRMTELVSRYRIKTHLPCIFQHFISTDLKQKQNKTEKKTTTNIELTMDTRIGDPVLIVVEVSVSSESASGEESVS